MVPCTCSGGSMPVLGWFGASCVCFGLFVPILGQFWALCVHFGVDSGSLYHFGVVLGLPVSVLGSLCPFLDGFGVPCVCFGLFVPILGWIWGSLCPFLDGFVVPCVCYWAP